MYFSISRKIQLSVDLNDIPIREKYNLMRDLMEDFGVISGLIKMEKGGDPIRVIDECVKKEIEK